MSKKDFTVFRKTTKLVHHFISAGVTVADTVIDATCGNGYDTVFLSKLVKEKGKVFAFDVQEKAIQASKKELRFSNANENVEFFQTCHSKIKKTISPDYKGKIKCAVFNLGYLPRSDKKIVTSSETSIKAISDCLEFIMPNGLVIVTVYVGHEEGLRESKAIDEYIKSLDKKLYKLRIIRSEIDEPYILCIIKL